MLSRVGKRATGTWYMVHGTHVPWAMVHGPILRITPSAEKWDLFVWTCFFCIELAQLEPQAKLRPLGHPGLKAPP